MNHAGVFGVENWPVEVDQYGVICDPEDDLDSIGLYVTADVEAPVNLFPQGQHLVVCFGEDGLLFGGWALLEVGGVPIICGSSESSNESPL